MQDDQDQRPSVLYIFWPRGVAPGLEELRYRAAQSFEAEGGVGDSDDAAEGSKVWEQRFHVPGLREAVTIWARRPDSEALELGCLAHWRDEREAEEARACQWWIGVEVSLDPFDPLKSYHTQLRFCRELVPESPALFDACSMRVRSRQELERLTTTRVPPRLSELFSVHTVASEGLASDVGAWVHSHGLARAGGPEIDLLGVPADFVAAAHQLVGGAAELVVAGELPRAGQRLEIGENLRVTWSSWQDTLFEWPHLLDAVDAIGDGDEHGGERIVLVELSVDPRLIADSPCPLDALSALKRRSGVLFMSKRETERMAHMARERWSIFGMLFARSRLKGLSDWRFVVKLGYPVDGTAREHEHLWFRVEGIAPDRVRGVLLNEPIHLPDFRRGAEGWHDLEQLTDWGIETPRGSFSPETADILWDIDM